VLKNTLAMRGSMNVKYIIDVGETVEEGIILFNQRERRVLVRSAKLEVCCRLGRRNVEHMVEGRIHECDNHLITFYSTMNYGCLLLFIDQSVTLKA
jgi:hypothetical protein